MKQILNFINGEYAAGERTFDKRSPLTGQPVAQVHEAGARRSTPRCVAARAALQGPWGRMSVAERVERLYAVADGINRRFDEFLAAEMRRHRQAAFAGQPHRHPARRGELQGLRRRGEERAHRVLRDGHAGRPRRHQLRPPRPGRRGGGDLPLEPAAAADDLEGRAGARLRQHGGRQALGGNAADGDPARRGDERGGHAQGRLQRRARLRPRLRGRVPDHASRRWTPSPSPARRAPAR